MSNKMLRILIVSVRIRLLSPTSFHWLISNIDIVCYLYHYKCTSTISCTD